MKIDISLVKELRERTGLSITECKKALEESGGNLEKSLEILKEKGIEISEKKAKRETREGLIGTYTHTNGKIGVMVEVNCESDFVAKTDDFKELVKNLTLQVTATNPSWIDKESVPKEIIEQYGENEQKKLEEFFKEKVLLEQPFIKDESITIKEYINSKISKLGENIKIKRFVRFEIGG